MIKIDLSRLKLDLVTRRFIKIFCFKSGLNPFKNLFHKSELKEVIELIKDQSVAVSFSQESSRQ